MAYNKTTGKYEGFIYVITNNVNGKQYVGQTNRTVDFRFQQHQYRRTKAKYTQPIYNAFKKYGIDSFSVEEICKLEGNTKEELSELLNDKEIFYIKEYNSKVPNGYNVLDGGDVNPTCFTVVPVYEFDTKGSLIQKYESLRDFLRKNGLKGETALRQHIKEKTLYKGSFWSFNEEIDISEYKIVDNVKTKKVYQFDLKGNLLNEYISANAIDKIDIAQETVQKACRKSPHYSKGYIWLYKNTITKEEIDNVFKYLQELKERMSNRSPKDKYKSQLAKPVYQFTLDRIFIKRWDSNSEASLYVTNGRSRSALQHVLGGVCSQAYGYLWSYSEIPPEKYKTRIEKFGKKVNKYDLDFNYIETFDSAIEASLSVGSKCYQSISGCCKGKTHHSFGYIWRYVGENDDNPYLYYENMGYMQSVDMYDLKNNYIATYDNMISISEDYNPSLILRCCQGKIKKAYNHIWKFNNNAVKSA